MNFLNKIENNSILLVPNNIKNKILEYINDNKLLLDIKFMTFRELKVGLLYDYTNEAIYHIMKEKSLSYNIAKSYINDTYYLDKDKYDNKKLENILDIKNDLDKNGLLIRDNLFPNLLKSKSKLYVYGFSYINKFNKHLLQLAKEYIEVEEIESDKNNDKHEIYELKTMNEEIQFVAERILDLVNEGIELNNIYITNYSDEYYFTISRIFKSYGIPFYLRNETSLYQTSMGLYLINNLIDDKDKMLFKLRSKFDTDNNEFNLAIYNKIFNLFNTYTWIDNLTEIKDLIIAELKNTKVASYHHDNEVSLTNITDNVFSDDEYVFLIGYNLGSIPKFKKDEDYINDDIKTSLQETTTEYNSIQKEIILNSISNIKNLTITYKLLSTFEKYQASFLVDENDVTKIDCIQSKYNHDINRLTYTSLVDRLIKFGEKNDTLLPILKNSYDLKYKSYDNKFTEIDDKKLREFLNNNIVFSYSNIKQYYQCPFKFYLSSVLNITDYEQNFGGFIGNLFHDVLQKCLTDESKDIDTIYYDYIKNNRKNITNKEKFFCEKLNSEMHTVIELIRRQYTHSKHTEDVPEERFVVDVNRKINSIIKGFIDKILVYEDQIIIIDYKTNDELIDLDLLDFGYSLQLPVYLYLLSQDDRYKDKNVIGLYIQNILDIYNKYDPNKDPIEERYNGLRLNGITFNTFDISNFDDTYDKSEIIKGLGLKDGDFKLNKCVIDIQQREVIKEKITKLIEDAIDNISDGKFDIHPLKIFEKQIDGCEYCEFKDICYRKFKDFKIADLDSEVEEND